MNICIINTGGTISCVGDPLGPMSAADFASACQKQLNPIVKSKFPQTELTYETSLSFPESQTGTLDSTNLQPSDWCLMAEYILDNYSTYDGFVILHGTDSIDFTGSALPFLLQVFDERGFAKAALSKSVVITGSQVPMFYQSADNSLALNFNTDAFQNFCGAIACARLSIPEVGVYFDSRLYRGNRSVKVNASEFKAFSSPNYPALAQYGIEMEQFTEHMLPGPVSKEVSLNHPNALALAKQQLLGIKATIDQSNVMPFSAFPAAYSTKQGSAVIAQLLQSCVSQGIKGLVLESYGEGNFPSGNPDTPSDGAIYQTLLAANEAGVTIIDSTQVISGIVNDSAYAAGAWLPQVGALGAYDMTPIAAQAKSVTLLAASKVHGWSLDIVKTLLQTNLSGEILSANKLDSRINPSLLSGQAIASFDGRFRLHNDPRLGVQLLDNKNTVLWQPLEDPIQGCRLDMQNDGNLVIYNAQNQALWATDTGNPRGASSALLLFSQGNKVTLAVVDYSHQQTHVVFTQG